MEPTFPIVLYYKSCLHVVPYVVYEGVLVRFAGRYEEKASGRFFAGEKELQDCRAFVKYNSNAGYVAAPDVRAPRGSGGLPQDDGERVLAVHVPFLPPFGTHFVLTSSSLRTVRSSPKTRKIHRPWLWLTG